MAASGETASAWTCILMKKRKASNGCSISPAMTLPLWSRSPVRAQATSTPACLFSSSSPLWPRHLPRNALLPATPISSHGFRRRAKPTPSSSAGVKTGRTRSRICYPPSMLPHGYRRTYTFLSQMHRSTAKTQPSTPPPELASLARAAADTIRLSSATCRVTSASTPLATTARLRHSLTGRLPLIPDSFRSRTAGATPRNSDREPSSAATLGSLKP